MSAACNGGTPISLPQWYSVGKKVTGWIRVAVDAVTYPRGAAAVPNGSAVVDHWSGKVLACTGETVQRWSRPVDVVGYLTEPYDLTDDHWGFQLSTSVLHAVSAAPANDHVANAQPLATLPFTATVDTSLADGDGPDLIDYQHCLLSSVDPVQAGTIWYSYRPTKTGPAPVVEASPANAWNAANGSGYFAAGVFEVLGDGSAVMVKNADPWDCDTPVRLVKGKRYLIGIGYTWDTYSSSVPVHGGPVSVSISAR